MNISIIGTGYVGLVTGTCLAEVGHSVTCVDIDINKIDKLNNSEITIYEPGLEVIFKRNQREKRLFFSNDLKTSVKSAQIIFLALPTPPGEDGSADLKYVLNVSKELSQIITDYKVIVTKSTVPVGTGDKIEQIFRDNCNSEVDIVSNPEFLREGSAVEDFMKPDRIVIGCESEKASLILEELYSPFVRQGNPIFKMNRRSSELTKYAANSFLATKISFMNEVANLCELLKANVDDVRLGIGSDSRIGKRFLFPGIGYGGSCFPKDVKALSYSSQEVGYDFKILKAVEEVNQIQKSILIPKILKSISSIKSPKVAVWGLAFKANTDDTRESPALEIINGLVKHNIIVNCYDPEAINQARLILKDKVNFYEDMYSAIADVDCLVIATEWGEFRSPNFELIRSLMRNPNVIDGRNLFHSEDMKEYGFLYQSIGRSV